MIRFIIDYYLELDRFELSRLRRGLTETERFRGTDFLSKKLKWLIIYFFKTFLVFLNCLYFEFYS